jgi:hypothetical protein
MCPPSPPHLAITGVAGEQRPQHRLVIVARREAALAAAVRADEAGRGVELEAHNQQRARRCPRRRRRLLPPLLLLLVLAKEGHRHRQRVQPVHALLRLLRALLPPLARRRRGPALAGRRRRRRRAAAAAPAAAARRREPRGVLDRALDVDVHGEAQGVAGGRELGVDHPQRHRQQRRCALLRAQLEARPEQRQQRAPRLLQPAQRRLQRLELRLMRGRRARRAPPRALRRLKPRHEVLAPRELLLQPRDHQRVRVAGRRPAGGRGRRQEVGLGREPHGVVGHRTAKVGAAGDLLFVKLPLVQEVVQRQHRVVEVRLGLGFCEGAEAGSAGQQRRWCGGAGRRAARR